MKKAIIGMLLLVVGLLLNWRCSEYEMIQYSEKNRINFVGIDKSNQDTDDPSTLNAEMNFGLHLKGDSVNVDTLLVRVRLQGHLSASPLKIVLKADAVDGFPAAEVIFPEAYQIADSAYRAVLKVVVKRPALRDKEYRANLVFDYDNSDVAIGVDTLKTYRLTVRDELTLKMLKIDQEYWDQAFAPKIGPYSNVKIRFMVMTTKSTDFSTYNWLSALRLKALRDALTAYNTANPGNPLKDENGNLVNFDPA